MKNLICITLILLSHIAFAQKKAKTPKLPDPPNCVWVEKGEFFIDQTEIANIHWLEFIADKEVSENMKLANLPDTTVWQANDKLTNNTYVENYFRYRGFHFFPLVGVSYEQAKAFCKWRSEIVTENFNKNKRHQKGRWKKYKAIFTYRLPTEKEWEIAAQGLGQDEHGFNLEKPKIKKKDKKYYSNDYRGANIKQKFESDVDASKTDKNALITEYMFAGLPNDFGLYNMIGNIAEMVEEKGIAKGGSWIHNLEDSKIKNQIQYEKPEAWLGFRCVCEVRLEKK